jgi:hypothetical protein
MESAVIAHCESCAFRRRAEQRPRSLLARLWRWHTRWCPGWKSYQRELARRSAPVGEEDGAGSGAVDRPGVPGR